MRRLIAGSVTGLVTFLFLVVWHVTAFMPPVQAYAVAGLVAAAGAMFWPLVVGLFFAGRARARRREIQRAVDRQLAQQAEHGAPPTQE
jgi:membrane protein implicated in regulation of membrane protease activity